MLLSLREANLIFAVSDQEGRSETEITLSTRPFRRIIKDYFLICDSYFQAIRSASPSRIEAIDMGRRGLHNEGAEKLAEALAEQGRDRRRDRAPAVHPDLRPPHPCLRPCDELPGSVLFACTHNAIRSPMAEAVMKYLHGRRVYVDSVGLRPHADRSVRGRERSTRSASICRATGRRASTISQDDYFDLVISLSPEAQHRAVELTRTSSCEIEFWPTMDPSLAGGSREQRLAAYRALRDDLLRRLARRFPPAGAPVMA